ncbi:MAG: DNA (cytosine-5-)-methyltransferase [Bacteroidales bacterium]
MRVLSLFDGISCGRVAFERAGISVNKYIAYEIDKYAISVSKKNYPDIEHYGDVIGVDFAKHKQIDIVIGGFPCTDLSLAKKNRQGLKGNSSSLFFELARAIKETSPKYFLIENNYGMPKIDFEIICKILQCRPILINSSLVSAQNRRRYYWTNIAEAQISLFDKGANISQPNDMQILLKDILISGKCNTKKSYALTTSYAGAELKNSIVRHQRSIVYEPCIYQRQRGYNKGGIKVNKSPALTSHSFQENNMIIEPVKLGNSKVGRIYSIREKTIEIKEDNSSIKRYKVDLPNGEYAVRKLSPIECERLQTLPDNYTLYGLNDRGENVLISNAQRYRQLGNAWTVDVVAHIFRHIKA